LKTDDMVLHDSMKAQAVGHTDATGYRSPGGARRAARGLDLRRQAWNQERGDRSRFAEYTLFFDDIGALIVVAYSCRVSP
jgi:hypothetical protein